MTFQMNRFRRSYSIYGDRFQPAGLRGLPKIAIVSFFKFFYQMINKTPVNLF